MKTIFTSILVLLVIIIGITKDENPDYVWGTEKNVFTKEELKEMAESISKIDMMASNLRENHNFYIKDSIDITATTLEERDKLWRDLITSDYASFEYGRDTKFLVNAFQINKHNFWQEKFIVYKCYHMETIFNTTDTSFISQTTIHPTFRILALDYGGSFYYLSGFDKDDFSQLIKSKIGIIKSKNAALKIALFYLNNVEAVTEQFYEIIDDSNYVNYRSKFEVEKPILKIENTDYHAKIYAINTFTKKVNIYRLVLSQDGLIKHQLNK